MEIPLTPMEFARRARRLYSDREAVVDGDLRFTYGQFLDRCDRWSSALQGLGVEQGDRVAYIAPNTHSHLEGYYAVPQIGAVLVPVNYRLLPDDFDYIINHCGAKVVCVHEDYIDAIDSIRGQTLWGCRPSLRWRAQRTAGSTTKRPLVRIRAIFKRSRLPRLTS